MGYETEARFAVADEKPGSYKCEFCSKSYRKQATHGVMIFRFCDVVMARLEGARGSLEGA